MDVVLLILKLIGAIGVFLFGMKLMSESLQRVAGQRLKGFLAAITGNRFTGVITGFSMTTLVQSSSATTVMVVSFVNAKLLNLRQAIGVVMGANIGTTVTGWLVALLGFKVKITAFALPAIAIGFLATFAKPAKIRYSGEVFVGFGLLFLGLALMKDQVPKVGADEVQWITDLTGMGLLSNLLFVGVGTGLTAVMQSSSATMALTLTLVAGGLLPYDAAAAMILGENIGTTITANVAAIGTTAAAVRTARAHFIFNILGALWALALMDVALLPLVDWMVPGDPAGSLLAGSDDAKAVATAHLAAFHTTFNVINTALLLPFVDHIASVVTRWVPERTTEPGTLRHLSATLVGTPDLIVVQARRELAALAVDVRELYGTTIQLLLKPSDGQEAVEREAAAVLASGELVDRLAGRVTEVLAEASRSQTSDETATTINRLLKEAQLLERVGDLCEKLARVARRNGRLGDRGAPSKELAELDNLTHLTDMALANLAAHYTDKLELSAARELERKVNSARDKLRARFVSEMESDETEVVGGLILLDAIRCVEEIADRVWGIVRPRKGFRSVGD